MPINNINTLQNYDDIKYTSELANQNNEGQLNTDYYIHALANLEQRNEYRFSNGIKYGILVFDTEVKISRNQVDSDMTTFVELKNDMSFDVYVNNIETYLRHSQIYNNGIVFRSLLFGKILGTDDSTESNNVEIQYTEIDLKTHTINEAYRAFYLNDSVNSNIYVIIHLLKEASEVNEIKYILTVHKLSIPSNNISIRKFFKASTYESANYDPSININIADADNKIVLFTELSKFSIYSDEVIENNYTLECSYNTIEEYLIKITNKSILSPAYNKINELLYFNYYNIDQYIRALNNDLSVTYPNILKYYSNKQFNSNNDTLKLMIAKALFDHIYNNEGADNNGSPELIIPEKTTITYVSNVENALQLYYTDDIYVYFINNSEVNLKEDNNINGIKYIYSKLNKTVLYNIYSKYNTKYPELIDNFVVYKKYTLPYIDDSHLWNINDNQTSIYASGESAGNPNIFIIKTELNIAGEEYTINGKQLNRNDIQDNMLKYSSKSIDIKYHNISTGNDSISKYVFAVPDITTKSIDKLKYATLFIISNITEIGNNKYDKNAPTVTTIWALNNPSVNNKSEFVCVKLDDDTPLTADDMFGFDSLIYRKFTEYGHISNVFDDIIALRLPYPAVNGSDALNSNFFVIERNTYLDTLSSIDDPNTYNFNEVEFKVNNVINYPSEYSYAVSSKYNDDIEHFINLWKKIADEDRDHGVKTPYYLLESLSTVTTGTTASLGANTNDVSNNNVLSQNITISSANINNTMATVIGSYDDGNYNNINNARSLDEYIPKSHIPILKESNILHQDNNIISRTNIYSFDKNGNIYYAYIGSSCSDADKNNIHIGTADFTYMVNLGKESLIDSNKIKSSDIFNQADNLHIDIANTYINSTNTVIDNLVTDNVVVRTHNYGSYIISGIEIYSMNNIPSGNSTHMFIDYRGMNTDNNSCFTVFTYFKISQNNNQSITESIKTFLRVNYPYIYNNLNLDSIAGTNIAAENRVNISGSYINGTSYCIFDRPFIINVVRSVDNNNNNYFYIPR